MSDKSDKTFRFDNFLLESMSDNFGARSAKPGQPYLPGMHPFGSFDWWLTAGCYALLDAKRPTDPVVTPLTDVLELLDFSRILTRADTGNVWVGFASDDYGRVKEAFHRLRTVEFPIRGEWKVVPGKGKGKPRRRYVEYYTGILSYFGYHYPPGVIPPDQLPEPKRKNVNRALTTDNEPGPAIFVRVEGPRPEAVEFQMSDVVVRALTGAGDHIGATTFPVKVFELRRPLANNFTGVKLLFWTCRQTKKNPATGLDRLLRRLKLYDPKGRNTQRTRDDALDALAILRDLGVIESFNHDPATDKLVVVKGDDWHFPSQKEDELGILED